MNIVFWGISYPEGMAMTSRLRCYCKALSMSNYDYEITICSEGGKEEGGVYDGFKYKVFKKKQFLSPQLDRFFVTPLKLTNFLQATKQADVVCITRSDVVWALIMILISRVKGFRLVMELNENPYVIDGLRFNPMWYRKFKRWLGFHTFFKMMDGFLCISDPLYRMADKYRKKSSHIVKIPILCETLGVDYCPNVTNPYIFNPGTPSLTKDGYLALIEGFCKANIKLNGNIRFIQTSKKLYPEALHQINQVLEKYEMLDSFNWTDYLEKSEVKRMQSESLVAVLNKPSNIQNDYNFPTKLGEFMSKGIPVIATNTGELGKYLIDNVNAIIIPENDTDAIADAIVAIYNDQNRAKELGLNGFETAKTQFYYKNYVQQLETFFYFQ